jgi:hypothetical protein
MIGGTGGIPAMEFSPLAGIRAGWRGLDFYKGCVSLHGLRLLRFRLKGQKILAVRGGICQFKPPFN